jgi:hypothetical protein
VFDEFDCPFYPYSQLPARRHYLPCGRVFGDKNKPMKQLQFRAFSFIRVLYDIPRSENPCYVSYGACLIPPFSPLNPNCPRPRPFRNADISCRLASHLFSISVMLPGKTFVSHAPTTLLPFLIAWRTTILHGIGCPSNCAAYDGRDLADARVFRTHFSLSG